MGERLVSVSEKKGIDIQRLRVIGWILTAVGIAGSAIVFNKYLNAPSDYEALEAALAGNTGMGFLAIAAMVLEICAVPLFAFILVEGAKHTTCHWKYLLRVLGLAVVSEIPYDLAMNDHVLDWSSQNPVFGLALGLVMLYFFKHYCNKSVKGVLVAILVVVVTFLWSAMLRVDEGRPMVLMITVLWFTRNKKMVQVITGCVVTCFCSTFGAENIFYIAAPLTFLLIHYYNEEPGECNKIFNYAVYPVLLMGFWLIAKFVI